MKNKDIIIPLIVGIGAISLTAILNNFVQAQVEPTYRFFQKDYCETEKTLFDDITYNSPQDPLSYSITDCPVSSITINRWNELTTGEQTLITVRLNTLGYEDVTPNIQISQHQ